jgi:hypothetical protein
MTYVNVLAPIDRTVFNSMIFMGSSSALKQIDAIFLTEIHSTVNILIFLAAAMLISIVYAARRKMSFHKPGALYAN